MISAFHNITIYSAVGLELREQKPQNATSVTLPFFSGHLLLKFNVCLFFNSSELPCIKAKSKFSKGSAAVGNSKCSTSSTLFFSIVSQHQQQHHCHNAHITSEPSNIYIVLLHVGLNKANKAAHLHGKRTSCSVYATTRCKERSRLIVLLCFDGL